MRVADGDREAFDGPAAAFDADLRRRVVVEVRRLCGAADKSPKFAGAREALSDAQGALAFNPQSDEAGMLAEAQAIQSLVEAAAAQAQAAAVARYNLHALKLIREAIAAYGDSASAIPFRTDVDALVNDTARRLAPIDAALLEPAATSLYEAALDRAKAKLGDGVDAVRLAELFVDPARIGGWGCTTS